MSKSVSDQLFKLIHALSKSEKRAFMLYAGRKEKYSDRNFIRLFRTIEQQSKYNEEKILEKNPGFLPAQLPNMKAHLYEELLKSLRLLNSSRSEDMRLTALIDNCRVLYDKCLYQECIRMIDKAKQIAQRRNRPIPLLELLELEKTVARQTVAGKNEARVDSVIQQTEAAASSIRNINTFSNLALKLNSLYVRMGFVRNENDLKTVTRSFRRSMPRFSIDAIGFQEKIYLYYAYTGYYFFIQNFSKGYMYSRKWVELFEERPEMIPDQPELYIKALNSLLVAQNKLLLLDEFSLTLRNLTNLKRRKDIRLTTNITLNLLKAIYIHEINRHFMMGEFNAGTRIVGRLQHELIRYLPGLDKQSVMLFYYKIACLYFGSDNHREAIKWLNRIIQSREGDVREDLQEFARILSLISNYELGNDELIEYQVKSLYRFLLKKGPVNRYERYILGFLRRLPSTPDDRRLKKLFIDLREKMVKLEKNRFERRAFLYFDIITWLQSKIEGRKVQDIIREKANSARIRTFKRKLNV